MGPRVEHFLQSVVMFDDRAYASVGEPVVERASNPDELDFADDLFDMSDGALSPESLEEHGDFDTQAVVRGFADKGMTCAVLAPSDNDAQGDTNRFMALTKRADVVILDWIIGTGVASVDSVVVPASQNQTSLQLILEVLHEDMRVGSRLRFMCIYTGVANIGEVRRSVLQAMELEFPDLSPSIVRSHIDIGDARIVFLSKEGAVGVPQESRLSPEQLPGRVIEEFALFAANGILPRIAIQSLSAVRDQAHRLLRRFRPTLDPALLSHRAMTSPEATTEFVIDLVADELGSIVSRGYVSALLDDKAIDEDLVSFFSNKVDRQYWSGGRGAALEASHVTADVASSIMSNGIVAGESFVLKSGKKAKFPDETSLTSLMLTGELQDVRTQSKEIDLEFSVLSALSRDASLEGEETAYPELRLGTILCLPAVANASGVPRDRPSVNDNDRFYLCLQPICDSVRLDPVEKFPLLPLTEVSADSDRFGLVVKHLHHRLLAHTLKLGEIEQVRFKSDRSSRTVRARWSDGQWVFTGGTRRFLWVGDVRITKAHRLANLLSSNAGRIGINEYEYLRRRHEKN